MTRVKSNTIEEVQTLEFEEVELWGGLADVSLECICNVETDRIEPEGTEGITENFLSVKDYDVESLVVWFDGPSVPFLPKRLNRFIKRWDKPEWGFWLYKRVSHDGVVRHLPKLIVDEIVDAVGEETIEERLAEIS